MKYFGQITDAKDIVNKEYVDAAISDVIAGDIPQSYLKSIIIDGENIAITDQSNTVTEFANIKHLGTFEIGYGTSYNEIFDIEELNNCKTSGTYFFKVKRKTSATGFQTDNYLMIINTEFGVTQRILNLVTLEISSRSYLLNWSTPTITSHTVNDGILTIQRNGTNIGTFSANTSSNKTINIEVPTNNVTTDTTQTISGSKTFSNTIKFGKWQVTTNANNELEWNYVG